MPGITSSGVIGADAAEGALVRFAELVAVTVQLYSTPLVNPEANRLQVPITV